MIPCDLTYDRHINIYHAKSRLNTPVWGSLRSPNNSPHEEEEEEEMSSEDEEDFFDDGLEVDDDQ